MMITITLDAILTMTSLQKSIFTNRNIHPQSTIPVTILHKKNETISLNCEVNFFALLSKTHVRLVKYANITAAIQATIVLNIIPNPNTCDKIPYTTTFTAVVQTPKNR